MKTGEIIAVSDRSNASTDPLQVIRIKINRPANVKYPTDVSTNEQCQ